jgi:hypothetical protein
MAGHIVLSSRLPLSGGATPGPHEVGTAALLSGRGGRVVVVTTTPGASPSWGSAPGVPGQGREAPRGSLDKRRSGGACPPDKPSEPLAQTEQEAA